MAPTARAMSGRRRWTESSVKPPSEPRSGGGRDCSSAAACVVVMAMPRRSDSAAVGIGIAGRHDAS
eukprot:6183619-Pleurochrysis_carterae.AAC.3